MNKFEKLIEYIINDEDQKARELFHDIVVEKSRDIYESIMDEESMEETVRAQDDVESLTQEVSDEEAHMEDGEEGEEISVDGEDGFGDEEPTEFGGEEGEAEEHAEIEDQVMNIDAKLDELLAKFDEIMGDEGSAEEVPAEEPAFGGEEEVGAEEEPAMFEGENPFAKGSGKSGSAKSGKSGKSGSAQSGKSGSAKSGKPFESRKSTSELMREYVDKVGEIYGGQGDAAEGDAVGTGKKTSVNTKAGSVGPGADFGGETKNIARGGAETAPDGKAIEKPSNEYSKGEGKLIGTVGNTAGGKKDLKKDGTSYEQAPEGQEGKGVGTGKTDKPSVNTKSEIGGKVR